MTGDPNIDGPWFLAIVVIAAYFATHHLRRK